MTKKEFAKQRILEFVLYGDAPLVLTSHILWRAFNNIDSEWIPSDSTFYAAINELIAENELQVLRCQHGNVYYSQVRIIRDVCLGATRL